jgi:tetratricopeptide (TPR) repeat protein
LIMQLWEDWRKRSVVIKDQSSGRWSLSARQTDQVSGPVLDIFGDRIHKLMGTKDLRTFVETVYLLSCAALEGRQFTAQALARVVNRDPNELMDFLDETLLVCEKNPDGLLAEVGFLTINDYHGERNLFCYSFATDLFWMTLNRYGLTTEETPDLAHRLGQILIDEYSPQERQIARTLARLFRLAGDIDSVIKYQSLADFDMDVSANLLLVKHILSLPKDEWNKFDYARAISQMLDAGLAMYTCCPHSETLQVFKEAYKMAYKYRQYTDAAKALIFQGDVLIDMGDYASARALLPRLHKLKSSIKDRSIEARLLFTLGNIEYSASIDLATAQKHLQVALKIYRQLGERKGEAIALEGLGTIALENRNYDEVYQSYHEIEKIAKETGDQSFLARSYFLKAYAQYTQARYDSARDSILRILEIRRELKNQSHMISTLELLAKVENLSGNNKASRLYSIEGLQLAKDFGALDFEGKLWISLGVAQANLGWLSLGMQLVALGYLILNSIENRSAPTSYKVLSELASIEHCGKDQLATLLSETAKVYETDKGLGLLQKVINTDIES